MDEFALDNVAVIGCPSAQEGYMSCKRSVDSTSHYKKVCLIGTREAKGAVHLVAVLRCSHDIGDEGGHKDDLATWWCVTSAVPVAWFT